MSRSPGGNIEHRPPARHLLTGTLPGPNGLDPCRNGQSSGHNPFFLAKFQPSRIPAVSAYGEEHLDHFSEKLKAWRQRPLLFSFASAKLFRRSEDFRNKPVFRETSMAALVNTVADSMGLTPNLQIEGPLDKASTFGILQSEVLPMVEPQRQMHIRIPVQLHRALRVRAAAEDKTIQQLVIEILSKQVTPSLLVDNDTPAEGDFNDK